MEQAVESFSKLNTTLDKVEGESETVVAGNGFVVRLVEDVAAGKMTIPYAELLELLKAELEKDPKKVARDLLELIQPTKCLPTLISWFTRK
jgi:hypothetical protein